jgi:hypothetical protein
MDELLNTSIRMMMETGLEISMYLMIEFLSMSEMMKPIQLSGSVYTQERKRITVKTADFQAVTRES